MANLINKITVKTVKAQPKKHSLKEGEKRYLMDAYGRIQDTKAGSSDHGEYTRFLGEFEAVNIETGEVFNANEMILPAVIQNALVKGVEDNPDGVIEFAVRISAEYSEKGNSGYTFAVEPMVEVKQSDALVNLRQLVQSKALPAPEKAK